MSKIETMKRASEFMHSYFSINVIRPSLVQGNRTSCLKVGLTVSRASIIASLFINAKKTQIANRAYACVNSIYYTLAPTAAQ